VVVVATLVFHRSLLNVGARAAMEQWTACDRDMEEELGGIKRTIY
jgi:hypothetical protein